MFCLFILVFFSLRKKIPYVVTRDVCLPARPSSVEITLERGYTIIIIITRPIPFKLSLDMDIGCMYV